MKKPLYSLLIVTLILGIAWIWRNPLMNFFFPCESFGCIGSGILYFALYVGVAALSYISVLIYLYRKSNNFTKSFSYIFLSLLTLFGIFITDGIIEKKQMGDVMENAYKECMESFSGNARESAYCETYRNPQTDLNMTNSGMRENTGAVTTKLLTGIEWGVRTELTLSRLQINKESYTLDSENSESFDGATPPLLWENLAREIDLNEFDKLPEYPATFCPSCADSPEEFLTLSYNSGSKTVKYHETLDTIPALEPIRKELKNFYNTNHPPVRTEIQGIEMSMNGGLSCPNCIDTIKIYPNFIEYDKVTVTLNNNADTRPPAPIHFSGTVSEEDWKGLVGGLHDEDFQELDTNLPPPDWEGMWLTIEKMGLQKRYIINSGIALGPKLSELFRKIEEMKKNIREQGTLSQTQPEADTASGGIQKISINVSGMFGNTKVDISPKGINISSTNTRMNKSGALSANDWNRVRNSINLKGFLALDQKDPRFRCEACAYDGDNMKSITLSYSGGEKTISYGSKNDIKEFKDLDKVYNSLVDALVGKK